MQRITLFALAVVGATLLTGCAYPWPRLWRAPGPIYQQQQNATLHDPYADNDIGPEVVGGRPREFQNPLPEPVRSRRFTESLWPGR